MLLLYLATGEQYHTLKNIYIPLCFYFIFLPRRSRQPGTLIYIPLCFYFISPNGIELVWTDVFTFHYASTLSCLVELTHHSMNWIYIPLCFYFIQPGLHGNEVSVKIYIPLCFYFIKGEEYAYIKIYRFTFHYASTLSISGPYRSMCMVNLHSTMLLLYQPARSSTLNHKYHLHSTMLLLYRSLSRRCPRLLLRIYIPLCFYFISSGSEESDLIKKFTFHYASTLSGIAAAYATSYQHHLHSTMLLLYRERAVLDHRKFWIYIPLCFYFIGLNNVFNSFGLSIYIPLCFYFILFATRFPDMQSHLHSTMLLLYLAGSDGRSFFFFIYIPLCFYFILSEID